MTHIFAVNLSQAVPFEKSGVSNDNPNVNLSRKRNIACYDIIG